MQGEYLLVLIYGGKKANISKIPCYYRKHYYFIVLDVYLVSCEVVSDLYISHYTFGRLRAGPP